MKLHGDRLDRNIIELWEELGEYYNINGSRVLRRATASVPFPERSHVEHASEESALCFINST